MVVRDIKFRAFNGNRIVKVNTIGWADGEVYWVDTPKNDDFDEDLILMQYTGLKDKNGVEIYEGDIVHWMTEFISPMDMRTKHKIDINVEVHQKESGEWVMGKVGNTLFEELSDVEVIGNIYQNKNLLEG